MVDDEETVREFPESPESPESREPRELEPTGAH
jgi:hypothetical protein